MICRINFASQPAPEPDEPDEDGLTPAQQRTLAQLPHTLRKATFDWWHYRVGLLSGIIIDFAAARFGDREGWLVLRDARPVNNGKWPSGMDVVRDIDIRVAAIQWAVEVDS